MLEWVVSQDARDLASHVQWQASYTRCDKHCQMPTCSFSLLSLEGIPHNKVFDEMADSCSRRRTEDPHSQTGHRGVIRMRMEPQFNSLCEV